MLYCHSKFHLSLKDKKCMRFDMLVQYLSTRKHIDIFAIQGIICRRGRGCGVQSCSHNGCHRGHAPNQVKLSSGGVLNSVCIYKYFIFYSFSTGFLTLLIQVGCLSAISFFITKYRGNFVIAETHLDWRVSFIGI